MTVYGRAVPAYLILTLLVLNEKVLGVTQTLRAACCKVEPKIFTPPQTPSRGRGMVKI